MDVINRSHLGVSSIAPQRKTPLACQNCRLKKIKCDGARPVCTPCTKRGGTVSNCTYRHVEKKNHKVPERVLEELRGRIETLEHQHLPLDVPSAVKPAVSTRSRTPGSLNPYIRSISRIPSDVISPTSNTLVGGTSCEGDGEFFGLSSNKAFMNHVRQAIEGQSPDGDGLGLKPHRTTSPIIPKRFDYVLPPRQLADSLNQRYWEFVHPLYPFLHKESFSEIYEILWTGQILPTVNCAVMRVDEPTSVCILNLVLSLGCQYYEDIESSDCHKMADMFFERAHTVLVLDPIKASNNSLQSVQAMMLATQYLMGTGNSHKAWGIAGMAIRASYQLGLHRASEYDSSVLPRLIDREMIRRVYHGTLLLERLVCMNLGRPSMTASDIGESVSLPIEFSDAEIANAELQAPSASTISFFIHSIKLYEISQQILISFYSKAREQENDSYEKYFLQERSVFDLDNQLQKWRTRIPVHLRLETYKGNSGNVSQEHATFHRQSVILRLRYLQVRIYLLRPIFSLTCTSPEIDSDTGEDENYSHNPDDMLSYRTALQCSCLCVKAATELIDITHKNLTSSQSWGQKPSWLYGVLHVYLAATVLLAAQLKPNVTLGEQSATEIDNSWERAIQILENFQKDSASGSRCVTILRLLYRKAVVSGILRTHSTRVADSRLNSEVVLPESNQAEKQPTYTPEMHSDTFYHADATLPEVTQPSDWLDAFHDLDPNDMSWLNVVPGDLFSILQ